jgi:methylthioribose-1-phosphate isomerase
VKPPETMRWQGGIEGQLELLDQTLLPGQLQYLCCRDVQAVWDAIRVLSVRGAPAIGLAAAYGVCLGLQTAGDSTQQLRDQLKQDASQLASSRPTAVNLSWALERMQATGNACQLEGDAWREVLLAEARQIHQEDQQMCQQIGQHGASLLTTPTAVLTHCNAGGLATGGEGTALSVLFTAHQQGNLAGVFVGETRPLLQGARLTAWELTQRDIPTTLICDSMAGQVMREGKVQAVVTGADRIAANGDTANKIGTYSLALLARAHQLPFYVAAPSSSFDLALADGQGIPIEERDPAEVTHGFGQATAPQQVKVYNPAFDVTPAALIDAIITEQGIIQPVNQQTVAALLLGSG